jgi:hypothetical protein
MSLRLQPVDATHSGRSARAAPNTEEVLVHRKSRRCQLDYTTVGGIVAVIIVIIIAVSYSKRKKSDE